MELGTGIFLSVVFLGTVALFIATKDRWNWKKIILWPLGIVTALSLVGWLFTYAYTQYEERPKAPSEFKRIRLGEKFQDTVFKHGQAEREEKRAADYWAKYIVEHQNEQETLNFKDASEQFKNSKVALEKATAKENSDGSYYIGDSRVDVKDNQVITIAHECNTSFDSTSANGIHCNSNGDEILQKFNNSVRVLCPNKKAESSDLARVYDVVKYGTRYYLYQNSVSKIMVASPTTLDTFVGINWSACK